MLCTPAAEPTEAQRELLRVFRDEFVQITPGAEGYPHHLLMGRQPGPAAEQPVHRVQFDYSFAVGRYEVPQNLWQAVMGSNPSRWKGARNSVEMVSYHDAQQFCRRVTGLMRTAGLIEPGQIIRLPSEAEWEYAVRAGTSTRYSFGDDSARLHEFAWYTANAAGNDPPVGAKLANPWGLYDVHGYLWEWCQDAWHDDYQGAPADGSAWSEGGGTSRGVLRGGSWKDSAEKLTSSYRRPADRGLRDDAVGLRCVLADEDGR